MAWTTPRTWSNELVTDDKLNTDIGANQQTLKDPTSLNYELDEGSDYNYGTASYADVDSTSLSFTLDSAGGAIMLCFVGTILADGQGLLDIEVDGTRILNSATEGLISVEDGAIPRSVSFLHILEGLSVGSHTFILQWKPSTDLTMYAGAGTANYDLHGQFWAREVS